VILPSKNKPDLDELPEEVRNSMNFIFADTVEDVIKAALEPEPRRPAEGNGTKAVKTKTKKDKQTEVASTNDTTQSNPD
jgi:cation transport regulator ChaB